MSIRVHSWLAILLLTLFGALRVASADGVEQRVERILSQMTLAEKLDYLGGVHPMSIRAVPRLGLPKIRMADGPLGVRQTGAPSTRYPAGIALAASWDRALAEELGVAMARDCRARGIHVLLAPGVNLVRVPVGGRNFEYISGEDPYLGSQLVGPFIRGVQSQGVAATVKHFAVNNQEFNRLSISAEVSERALRELYLPVFEAAVRDAGVAAVMDAYNKLNGVYCTENGFLNNTVLKQEWGFDGVIMSDWGATHSTVRVVLNGMDLEMPSGFYLNPEKLLPAIEAGAVPESVIDDKVRRILRLIVRSGFLDRPQRDSAIPLNDPRSAETALRVAREGIVLLENRHGALPLDRAKIRSIAVLGPGAHPDVPAGWGSSFVVPFHATSVLDGLQRKCVGQQQIDFFSAGVGNFATARFETRDAAGHLVPGLRGEYFANATFAGEPVLVRIDQAVNFDWVSVPAVPIGPERFSVRWSGQIRPATSGLHVFRARSDDGIRVFLDDQVIIDDWDDHAARPAAATIRLEAERLYSIRIEYKNSGGGAVAQVGWDALEVPDVVRNYDAAIVCVGFDGGTEGEGFDRSFELPNAQNELIRQVTEKNANTIVILFSGGNVDMHPWVDRVAALLHAWYPGQEGGTAIAEVLLGDVTPAGKLPVTFEKKLEDNPAFPSYPSEDGGKTVRYAEDLFMGYRGYDRNGSAPRYPFGFGLSYTSFKYSALTVTEAANRLEVEFSVENIGDRPGAEVAQIYVSGPSGHLPRAVKELKGFERVELGPGEIRRIKTAVPAKGLADFDPAVQQWRIDPGTYRIMVGGSSRDLPLTQEVEWKAEDR